MLFEAVVEPLVPERRTAAEGVPSGARDRGGLVI
jgi:hypothetical protein